MIISVKVSVKAQEALFEDLGHNQFRAKLKSIPEKGKANEELIDLAADYFGVAKSQVRLLKGHSSKNKILEIA